MRIWRAALVLGVGSIVLLVLFGCTGLFMGPSQAPSFPMVVSATDLADVIGFLLDVEVPQRHLRGYKQSSTQ